MISSSSVILYGPNIKNKYACAIWQQGLKCEREAAELCISRRILEAEI
jgi:hypothetical protein